MVALEMSPPVRRSVVVKMEGERMVMSMLHLKKMCWHTCVIA
jgi:hypothetical protein